MYIQILIQTPMDQEIAPYAPSNGPTYASSPISTPPSTPTDSAASASRDATPWPHGNKEEVDAIDQLNRKAYKEYLEGRFGRESASSRDKALTLPQYLRIVASEAVQRQYDISQKYGTLIKDAMELNDLEQVWKLQRESAVNSRESLAVTEFNIKSGYSIIRIMEETTETADTEYRQQYREFDQYTQDPILSSSPLRMSSPAPTSPRPRRCLVALPWQERLELAIGHVRRGDLTTNKAAGFYGIAYETLRGHVKVSLNFHVWYLLPGNFGGKSGPNASSWWYLF